ncbi:hypothetical protein LIER_14342 [Lithospermum erythrorhizon]|uniref:Mitochondrial protein n=1 Tax=Lithospermum erythrorhizon TaxID=34254 RepID=A0AAV3Q231_LITER
MVTGLQLHNDKSPMFTDVHMYRRLIGRLLYLVFTRPDITYVVQQLSQFVQAPREETMELVAYSDADWVACHISRRSLIGFCIYQGQSLIS